MPETNPAAAGDAIDQGTYTGGAVVVLDGSGDPVTSFGGGVSHVDNAAFTVNVSSGTPIMGYFGTDAVTAGRAAVIAILGNRQQKVTLYDSSAAEITTWPVTNAGLTELAAAINASRVDVAIAADGAGLLTTTAHDAAFGTAGTADAQVRSIQGIASMTPVQVSQATAASLNAAVVGSVAHDTGTPGNPVVMAGSAQSLDGTAPPNRVSTEADVTRMATDFEGGQFAHPHGVMIWNFHAHSTAAVQTDASIAGGDPGDGFAVFITDIIYSNGAATASSVFIEEGSTTVVGPYYTEAIAGRGLAIHFVVPHRCTASTAVTVSTTGSITYGLDVHGFIAAV